MTDEWREREGAKRVGRDTSHRERKEGREAELQRRDGGEAQRGERGR